MAHLLRVVEREPVGDAGAAVMADEPEALEAELTHDRDLIGRHRALGIAAVVLARRRLGAVAIAAHVGDHDREILSEHRRHLVPHGVGLGISVEQKKRGSSSGAGHVDGRRSHIDARSAEAREQLVRIAHYLTSSLSKRCGSVAVCAARAQARSA